MNNLFLYTEEDSFFHRLDPRTKICLVLFLTLVPLLQNTVTPLVCYLLLLLTLHGFSKSLFLVKRFSVMLVLLFVFATILWPLFVREEGKPALYAGVVTGFRLSEMLLAGLFFLGITRVEEFLWGLTKFGVPRPVSFALSLSFRLVPTFIGTAYQVVQAQKLRGLDVETGSIFRRIKNHFPLMVPIFVCALRNAMGLSMALEARGFGADSKHTSYFESQMKAPDGGVFFILLCSAAIFVRLKFF